MKKNSNRALDVKLPEHCSIIGKLRARYPVITPATCPGFIAVATNTGKTVLENQMTDGLYYAVRYLSYMTSATVQLAQEASHQYVNRSVLVPCIFLRTRPNNGEVGIPPAPYCSVIHAGVHSYILITIFP